MTYEEYTQSVIKLNEYAHAYYVLDTPIATDEEYDILYHKVKEYESINKDNILPFSPTQRVGGTILKGFKKSKHLQRMWSLDDIFNITELEEWVNKIKKASNLIKAISNTKYVELWRFINALGIEHIGEGASKKLEYEFGLSCFSVSYEDLIAIDGFGEEIVSSFLKYVSDNRNTIQSLLDIIQPKIYTNENKQYLSGLSFVITGTLSIPRDDMKYKLESLGANISSSVSKKTDYLLYGKDAGSKKQKAIDIGIKIINEEQLEELINKMKI